MLPIRAKSSRSCIATEDSAPPTGIVAKSRGGGATAEWGPSADCPVLFEKLRKPTSANDAFIAVPCNSVTARNLPFVGWSKIGRAGAGTRLAGCALMFRRADISGSVASFRIWRNDKDRCARRHCSAYCRLSEFTRPFKDLCPIGHGSTRPALVCLRKDAPSLPCAASC